MIINTFSSLWSKTAVDWEGLGRAVESTLGVDNVVLEIIRQQNPLEEFAEAMRDLPAFGWNLGTREEALR